jgi:hypothetical protein
MKLPNVQAQQEKWKLELYRDPYDITMKIPNMQFGLTDGKTALGNPVFNLEVRNDSCKDRFVTVAVSEDAHSKRDMDTLFRDKRIAPGTSRTFEIPRGGNGVEQGALYRLTVMAACGKVLGSDLGALVGKGCAQGAELA